MRQRPLFKGKIYRGWTIRYPQGNEPNYLVSNLSEPDTLKRFRHIGDAERWIDRKVAKWM